MLFHCSFSSMNEFTIRVVFLHPRTSSRCRGCPIHTQISHRKCPYAVTILVLNESQWEYVGKIGPRNVGRYSLDHWLRLRRRRSDIRGDKRNSVGGNPVKECGGVATGIVSSLDHEQGPGVRWHPGCDLWVNTVVTGVRWHSKSVPVNVTIWKRRRRLFTMAAWFALLLAAKQKWIDGWASQIQRTGTQSTAGSKLKRDELVGR